MFGQGECHSEKDGKGRSGAEREGGIKGRWSGRERGERERRRERERGEKGEGGMKNIVQNHTRSNTPCYSEQLGEKKSSVRMVSR